MKLCEKVLLIDAKLRIKEKIAPSNESVDSFSLLMHSFNSENGIDYENGDFAKTIYKVLGWNDEYFDVINSFYQTYCSGLASICDETCDKLGMEGKEWQKVPFIIDEEGFKVLYSKDQKVAYNFMKKETLAKKILENTIYRKASNERIRKISEYNDFAALCHCVANFMPCPDNNFNSAKGLLADVRDYFPLMIDKIQQCIDYKKDLEFTRYGNKKIIDMNTLDEWHSWFVNNREKYCLEPYYYIKKFDEKSVIKGIPLFEKQSLECPYPKGEEVEKCLNEMIKRIRRRATLLILKYGEQNNLKFASEEI